MLKESTRRSPSSSPGLMSATEQYSRFRFGRREDRGDHFRLKAAAGVSAIAEGLVGGLTTAAKADHCPTGEVVFSTGGVIDLKVAFDPQRAILVNRNLSPNFSSSTSTAI